MANDAPLMEARGVSKYFGHVVALEDISMEVRAGQVMCLLGDNGAGKSTLIKTFSGVHQPTRGTILVDGEEVVFNSPRDAIDRGIATVYQDLAMIPLRASRATSSSVANRRREWVRSDASTWRKPTA